MAGAVPADPGGKQFTRTTRRKVDAQRWLDEQTTALVSGNYVDTNAGRVTFGSYYPRWAARQVWVSGTERAMELAARSTTFRDVPLQLLVRSHVETWVKYMQTSGLAASTVRTRFNNVRGVLRGAMRDRIIATDPSEGVKLPRVRRADAAMVLPTTAQVRALDNAAHQDFRSFVALCAFAGTTPRRGCGIAGRRLRPERTHALGATSSPTGRGRQGRDPATEVRQ